jgi:apolipoprotein N-acyltransferase
LHCTVAASAAAGLLWLSYFPVNCGWLAWVALVPWLMLVRAELPRYGRYLIAWLSAYAFFVPSLAWMRAGAEGMVALWLLLALYCSWFWLGGLWLIRRLDRRTRLPLTVTVPLVWVALEFVRSEFLGGFAWYLLGHTQHDFLSVIQVVDLAGVAAVTGLIAAVNGFIAEMAGRVPTVRGWFGLPLIDRRPAMRLQAIIVATLLVASLGYGTWRLNGASFAEGPRVALLQTCVGQTDRNRADATNAGDPLARDTIETQDARLARTAAQQSPRPDLLIFPETAFPRDWWEIAPNAPANQTRSEYEAARDEWCRYARQFVELTGIPTLLGLDTDVLDAQGHGHRYNSALLLTPSGEVVGRYDKIHLVPFGEYLPLKDMFPFVKRFSPYPDYDYSITPGDGLHRIPLRAGGRTYHFGTLICYEDADAGLARGWVRPGTDPPADFLVNISNDGWFMSTPEHAGHLAVCRFRAVECRRSIVRAVNGGISAVIDGCGRVVALPGPTWAASHSVTGVVTAAVPLDTRGSLFARCGDWLPWTCMGLLIIGCYRRPKDHPNP